LILADIAARSPIRVYTVVAAKGALPPAKKLSVAGVRVASYAALGKTEVANVIPIIMMVKLPVPFGAQVKSATFPPAEEVVGAVTVVVSQVQVWVVALTKVTIQVTPISPIPIAIRPKL
jgi:hypothetical protein